MDEGVQARRAGSPVDGRHSVGTCVVTLQQSNSSASSYSDVGTVSAASGTRVSEYYAAGAVTQRYVRLVATSTGGTSLMSASVIGQRRTITA
jgi:hypothetical protein